MICFTLKQAFRRKSVWFSVLVIVPLALVAILAPQIAPRDPYKMSITAKVTNLPPAWVNNPIKPGLPDYPLGTDRFGRDILSRLIYGTRTAFLLAFTAVPLTAVIGTLFGLIAGYLGGRFDSLIMLFTDLIQSLPGIMFVVMVILILRSKLTPTWAHGLLTLVIGFMAVSWVTLARLVRINVMLIKPQIFIEAARSLGASKWEIITRHLLPNVLHVILVWMINNIPAVILLEALLGYIGVGVTGSVDGNEFTIVSWGGLFFTGRSALASNPVILLFPSALNLLMSLSFILLANSINEITRHRE